MQCDNYQKLRLLGQGTYGKCYLALNRLSGEECVLKQIEIVGLTQEQISESVREAHILQALDSEFIIKFLTSFQSRDGYLNIVMAYAEGGDLSQRIRQARQGQTPLPEELILKWFTQICLAIKHVHDRKIIHRDLKAQNIFLTASGEVKLGDFGIARHLQHTIQKTKSVVGTPYYMSPEICENREYSFKADIWSLGVILLEMCLLRPPFDANSLPVLALKISKGEHYPVPKHYSREMRKLVAEMLQVDPAKRPPINEVLRHPLVEPRIGLFMPRETREREFSHTTLHAINIFDRAPSRGLFIDCTLENSGNGVEGVVSPKSAQQLVPKNLDMPVKRVDNYMKEPSKPLDKKSKKQEMRKREFSEPTLTPKGHIKVQHQRKIFSKNNAVVDKKKNPQQKERERQGLFKKKSRNVDIVDEVAEIMNIKKEIKGIHADIVQEEQSHRPFETNQEDEHPIPKKLMLREELQEDEDEEEREEACPFTDRQAPEPAPRRQEQKHQQKQKQKEREESLLQTLQSLIFEETHMTDLQDFYSSCAENDGICLVGPCAGLITLAFALKHQIC